MVEQVPKTLSQKTARKLLEANGWTKTEGGKHQVKMEKDGCRPITLPDNKRRDYPVGLRDAILKQADLKRVAPKPTKEEDDAPDP